MGATDIAGLNVKLSATAEGFKQGLDQGNSYLTKFRKDAATSGEAAGRATGDGFIKELRGSLGRRSEIGEALEIFKGAGAIGAIGIGAELIGKFGEAIKKSNEDFAEGKTSSAEYWGSIAEGVPIIGSLYKGFKDFADGIDGTTAALVRLKAENKAEQELEKTINSTLEAGKKLADRAAASGLTGEARELLENKQNREKDLADYKKNIADKIDAEERAYNKTGTQHGYQDDVNHRRVLEGLKKQEAEAAANINTIYDNKAKDIAEKSAEPANRAALEAIHTTAERQHKENEENAKKAAAEKDKELKDKIKQESEANAKIYQDAEKASAELDKLYKERNKQIQEDAKRRQEEIHRDAEKVKAPDYTLAGSQEAINSAVEKYYKQIGVDWEDKEDKKIQDDANKAMAQYLPQIAQNTANDAAGF